MERILVEVMNVVAYFLWTIWSTWSMVPEFDLFKTFRITILYLLTPRRTGGEALVK